MLIYSNVNSASSTFRVLFCHRSLRFSDGLSFHQEIEIRNANG